MEESHIFSQKRYRERPTSFSNVVGVCRCSGGGRMALGETPADSTYSGVGRCSSPLSHFANCVACCFSSFLRNSLSLISSYLTV